MSDDLIERLRGYGDGNNDLMDAAADRIEKLEAALREIAAASKVIVKAEDMAQALVVVLTSHRKIALAALEEKDG